MGIRAGTRVAGLLVAFAAVTGACSSGDGGDDATAAPNATADSSAQSTSSLPAAAGPPKDPPSTPAPTEAPAATPEPSPTPAAGKVIVIDPGHNGANGAHPEIINEMVDAGGFQKACNTTGSATDGGVTESSINWEVAQLLRDRLQAAGAQVIMTRDSDAGVGPCIDERGRTATNAGADALVSLHADGAPPEGHGFHIIRPGLRAGFTDATVEPSATLANQLRDALVAGGFKPSTYVGDNGVQERNDLGTLNQAGVPAVMLEAGNLRNADDAAWLTTVDGQSRLADAVSKGVLAALGHL